MRRRSAPAYQVVDPELDLAAAVASDPSGVGLVSMATLREKGRRVRPVTLDFGAGAVMPLAFDIKRGRYELTHVVTLVVSTRAMEREAVRDFVRSALQSSKDVAERVGFFPITDAVAAEARNSLAVAAPANRRFWRAH